MPNRMLRDWTDSEKVNELSEGAERFFTRLIMKADDYGGYFADAKRLLPNLFPFKIYEIKIKDVERWLAECEKAGLIIIFTHEGKSYLQIIDFRQRLDKSRAKYPFPPENITNQNVNAKETESCKSLTNSTEFPAEVEVEKKIEKEKKNTPNGVDGATAPPSDLEKIYSSIQKNKRPIIEFIRSHKPTFIQPYVDLWNIFAQEKSLPQVVKISGSRKRKFSVRIRETGFDFIEILKKAGQSEFLLTGNWFGFDWIIENDSNYLKILEGKYFKKEINEQPKSINQSGSSSKPLQTFDDEVKYFFGRFQEGELNSSLMSDEFCWKFVLRKNIPQHVIDEVGLPTEIERLRACVVSYFQNQIEQKKEKLAEV